MEKDTEKMVPAIIKQDGSQEWYLKGRKVTKERIEKNLKKINPQREEDIVIKHIKKKLGLSFTKGDIPKIDEIAKLLKQENNKK